MDDYAQLREGEHGVPTVSNIDTINEMLCRGNKKFAYRITNRNMLEKGEVSAKLKDELSALSSASEGKLAIIFVVPQERISEFTFPTILKRGVLPDHPTSVLHGRSGGRGAKAQAQRGGLKYEPCGQRLRVLHMNRCLQLTTFLNK